MRIYVSSRAKSAKDLPSHTELKFRQQGQAGGAELRARDLRVRAGAGRGGAAQKGAHVCDRRGDAGGGLLPP